MLTHKILICKHLPFNLISKKGIIHSFEPAVDAWIILFNCPQLNNSPMKIVLLPYDRIINVKMIKERSSFSGNQNLMLPHPMKDQTEFITQLLSHVWAVKQFLSWEKSFICKPANVEIKLVQRYVRFMWTQFQFSCRFP